jgi:DNA-binding NarL/FixJ family response regulator
MNKIRIVLADDHPLIRAGFRSLLGVNERFEIVAEAENGKELIERALATNPDIILADINMPIMSGLDAVAELGKNTTIKFIILTMHEEREYILQALKLGVSGYVLKNIERSELERAIITVYEEGKYFSPVVTDVLAQSLVQRKDKAIGEITSREGEVLDLVAQGNSTKQVADKLGISIRTVESHRINMLKKLQVNNTAELIRKAIELKLLR